uniref:Uncharacterized protein n=1 Tax=Anguilla anguilla TaxID=7936 RepID=A0A0E9WRT6_ANGAN
MANIWLSQNKPCVNCVWYIRGGLCMILIPSITAMAPAPQTQATYGRGRDNLWDPIIHTYGNGPCGDRSVHKFSQQLV